MKFNRTSNFIYTLVVVSFLLVASAWSATDKALYNFGSQPSSGLITDVQGNAYGTTSGGPNNSGTFYEVSPATGYHLLYVFHSKPGTGGWRPQGNLVLDSAGNLYGTTVYGGANNKACANQGCGVIFELSPPSNGGLWTETVLYSFCSQANCSDGANPQAGVVFDSTGNLYGTTEVGGLASNAYGTVFKLSLSESGWIESVIYDFAGGSEGDGASPESGLTFDAAGNLYGTTMGGGETGNGTVFELSPVGSGWVESVLYTFKSLHDGIVPVAGVILDFEGNLYGTTTYGGAGHAGTVFELAPNGDGVWTETILHDFGGGNDGDDAMAAVVFDSSGNLYGTTVYGGSSNSCGGYGCGTVYKLTPQGGEWIESIFRIPANSNLGNGPSTPVTLDSAGNVYAMTTSGGNSSNGVLFEIRQ
jgi:uncharacterized repeat protein (TIGR03803 family)